MRPDPAKLLVMASAKARPIQSSAGSWPRFSKRSTASRSTPAGLRPQPEAASNSRAALQNARLKLEQFLEFGHLLERGKLGLFPQLVFLLEALFQSLADMLQRKLRLSF